MSGKRALVWNAMLVGDVVHGKAQTIIGGDPYGTHAFIMVDLMSSERDSSLLPCRPMLVPDSFLLVTCALTCVPSCCLSCPPL